MVFEQTLSGLIKALRANKRDEHKVINTALAEIRDEVRSKDWDVKAAAVLKLTYLEMLGHPTLIQHSFPVIECMAAPKFHIKQIGYLAASQSFGESTEVILLANNLIKKDLTSSSHPSTVILALTSLPTLLEASPQLAADLLPDLLRMLTHSRSQVRRIATLVIGKIWSTSSSASTLEFAHVEKLRNGLNDEDPSVISATVNVMLELGRARPDSLQSLLGLAPELFELLTNSTNNWMLIKIVKLFALLTPVEPRLVRKLLPPLSSLISSTPAFSLLYECIQTVIIGGMLSPSSSSSSSTAAEATSLASTCIDKLSSFLSDSDQNLRYIALKGLSALLGTHSHLLSSHYEEILACIEEDDLTIRLKALELVERLTDRSNCKEVVGRLLGQISPSANGATNGNGRRPTEPMTKKSAAASLRAISSSYDTSSPSGLAFTATTTGADPQTTSTASSTAALSNYRYRLLLLILRLTSRASENGEQLYVNITNFEWYIDTLITVSYLSLSVSASSPSPAASAGSLRDGEEGKSTSIGAKVAEALLDVTARAPGIREGATRRMKRLLGDEGFHERGGSSSGNVDAVLSASAFIVSEYGEGDSKEVMDLLLDRAGKVEVGGGAQRDLVLGGVKVLGKWLEGRRENWEEGMMEGIRGTLREVVERLAGLGPEMTHFVQLVQLVQTGLDGPRYSVAERPVSQDDDHMAVSTNDHIEDTEENPDYNPFAASTSSSTKPTPEHQQSGGQDSIAQQGPPMSLGLLHSILFAYELKPLAPNAQSLVNVPEELDLDAWIGPSQDYSGVDLCVDSDDEQGSAKGGKKVEVDEYGRPKVRVVEPAQQTTPLGGGESKKKKKDKGKGKSREQDPEDDVDSIPIVKLDLEDGSPLLSPPLPGSATSGTSSSILKKKRSKASMPIRQRTPSPPPLILSAGGEMPSGPGSRKVPTATAAAASPIRDTPAAAEQEGRTEEADRSMGDTVAPQQAAVKVVKVKKKKTATPVDGEEKVKKEKKQSKSKKEGET